MSHRKTLEKIKKRISKDLQKIFKKVKQNKLFIHDETKNTYVHMSFICKQVKPGIENYVKEKVFDQLKYVEPLIIEKLGIDEDDYFYELIVENLSKSVLIEIDINFGKVRFI